MRELLFPKNSLTILLSWAILEIEFLTREDEIFEASKNDYGDAQRFFESAKKKNAEGDFHGALEDLNRAIELDPANIELYCYRGDLKIKLGDQTSDVADWAYVEWI